MKVPNGIHRHGIQRWIRSPWDRIPIGKKNKKLKHQPKEKVPDGSRKEGAEMQENQADREHLEKERTRESSPTWGYKNLYKC